MNKLSLRARLGVLLFLLSLALASIAARLTALNQTAYAFTLSFGNGLGYVFYCDQYYELPPILQESVDIHENVHLQDGTVGASSAAGEVHAYSVQLNEIRRKMETERFLYRKTGDPKHKMNVQYLRIFERSTIELLREYEAMLDDRKPQEGH